MVEFDGAATAPSQHRGEAARAEDPTTRSPGSTSTTPTSCDIAALDPPVGARRARDHRRQPRATSSAASLNVELLGRGYAWLDTGTHDSAARGRAVHRHAREAPGPEGRVPRGDRLPHRLDRREALLRAGPADGQERLRPVPARSSPRPRCSDGSHDRLALADVLIVLEPKVFADARGFFFESFNQRRSTPRSAAPVEFVQDNHSVRRKGVLRGLHYQAAPHAQGKLVRVAAAPSSTSRSTSAAAAHLRPLGRRRAQRRQPSPALDPARLRARLPRARGRHRVPLQDHHLPRRRQRTHHPLGRPAARHRLADLGPPMLSAKDAIGTALAEAELFE